MQDYEPYLYKRKRLLIDRYLCLGYVPGGVGEDPFTLAVPAFIQELTETLRDGGHEAYPPFDGKSQAAYNAGGDCRSRCVYLLAEVYSRTKTDALICCMACHAKIWLNGTCVAVHYQDYPSEVFCTVPLRRGWNAFVIGQYPGMERKLPTILFYYPWELTRRDDVSYISQSSHRFYFNRVQLIHEPPVLSDKRTFRFMGHWGGSALYDSDYRVELYDSSLGLYKQFTASLNTVVELDAEELRRCHPEPVRHQRLLCIFTKRDGSRITEELNLFPNGFPETETEAERAAPAAGRVGRQTQRQLERTAEAARRSRQEQDYPGWYWAVWNLRELHRQIEEGTIDPQEIQRPGIHETFIHSELDDSEVRLLIRIPEGYYPARSYPAILALSTGNTGEFCWRVDFDCINAGCLVFDVTGRGFTGGSYVGEACIFEILEWIKRHYTIDENRLYFVGGSNGGYATWAVAQNHPHLPAAIFPHIGRPAPDSLRNIANLPSYLIVSDGDSLYERDPTRIQRLLGAKSAFHPFYTSVLTHDHCCHIFENEAILRLLLTHTRNPYPDDIRFRTGRNRHLTSYWLRLHGISHGKRFAEITAHIQGNRILVRCIHTEGFTLYLPPQIDRREFRVEINGAVFSFENHVVTSVIFRRKNRKWTVADREPAVNLRKGTGLLDVYMTPMRIILPDSCPEPLRIAADHLAHPWTNGVDPRVYVDYPVYSASQAPKHCLEYGLILLDVNHSNDYIRMLRGFLLADYSAEGYCWQGTWHTGGYLLFQVIPNPYDRTRSILVISTNALPLLGKCLFLRRVILPYYYNGRHPFWNNQLLLFDGKEYRASYEDDGELLPIG